MGINNHQIQINDIFSIDITQSQNTKQKYKIDFRHIKTIDDRRQKKMEMASQNHECILQLYIQ